MLQKYPTRIKLLLVAGYLTLSHLIAVMLCWGVFEYIAAIEPPAKVSSADLVACFFGGFIIAAFVFYFVLKIKFPADWILKNGWNTLCWQLQLGYLMLPVLVVMILYFDGMIILELLRELLK